MDTRRGLGTRTAAMSGALAAWIALGYSPAAAQQLGMAHGRALRGLSQHTKPGYRGRQGRFGLMFPKLTPFLPDDDLLLELAAAMRDPNSGGTGNDHVDELPAGFTYVGQFVDHDMTLDTTTLGAENDPDALFNFRQPTLNLDSVYDSAPRDGQKLLVVRNEYGVLDVPRRSDGTARIGDARNDENLTLQPIHLAVMRLHNRFVAEGLNFEQAQQQTRWHYQWAVATEFLPAIVGPALADEVLEVRVGKKPKIRTRFYKPGNPRWPMMPVEFAAATYRLHTMIRNNYNIGRGAEKRLPIMQPQGSTGESLVGGRPVPVHLAMEFDLFFRTGTSPLKEGLPGVGRGLGFNVVRKFDELVSANMADLPFHALPNNNGVTSIMARNLIRGKQVQLPSGQDVAREMGVQVLTNSELSVNTPVLSNPRWGGKAPLWFYINAEARVLAGTRHLGPAGGRIVAETVAGLLEKDRSSFINVQRGFTPRTNPFGWSDLLRMAGVLV